MFKNLFSRNSLLLIVSVLLCLVVRGLYLYQLEKDPVFYNLDQDMAGFDRQGVQLAASGKYEGAYIPPFYPGFLAFIYKISGHDLVLPRLVQLGISALSAALVFFIALKLAGPLPAFISAFVFSFWGMSVFYTGEIMVQTFELFWVLLFFFLFLRGSYLLSGLSLALGILTKPTAALIALPAAVILLSDLFILKTLKGRRKVAKNIFLFGFGLLLLLAPWTARNYSVFNRFVLVSTNGGVNLWIGNNPGTTGKYSMQDEYIPAFVAGLPEIEKDRLFSVMARDYIRRNPRLFIRNFFNKTMMFLSGSAAWNYIDRIYRTSNAGVPLFELQYILPLVPLGLLLIRRRAVLLMVSVILIYTAQASVFFANARFRLVIVPYFIILAAAGCAEVFGVAARREYGKLAAAFGGFLMLFIFTLMNPYNRQNEIALNYVTFGANDRAIRELLREYGAGRSDRLTLYYLANLYYSEGDTENGIKFAEEGIKKAPGNTRYYEILGSLSILKGNKAKALEYFKASEKIVPTLPALYKTALVCADNGQFDEAVAYFNRSLSVYPYYSKAYEGLASLYFGKGLYNEALGQYYTALKMNPGFLDGYEKAGYILMMKRDLEKAAALYRASIEISPRQPGILFNLGLISYLEKDAGKAIDYLNSVLRFEKEGSPLYINSTALLAKLAVLNPPGPR